MAIVNDNSANVFASLEAQQDAFLADLLAVGTDDIKQETPVDTGTLQANNQWEMTGQGEGRWFNDTEYAVPVELGHTGRAGNHIPANAFMQRGVDRAAQRAEQIAREHFKDA